MLESVSTIVVPVDFSNASETLLRSAINVARAYDAEIHLLHVYQDVFSVLSMRTFDLSEEVVENVMLKEIETKFDQLLTSVPCGVPVKRVLRKGETAEEILDYAKETATDLIVISTNARSSIEQFFIGSITQRVVRYASCPVLTLHALDAEE
ncbi:MAG: universal stress protein [Bacteroidetes bacterium]|nr:universal stress protein [Bacteroidota bacterium]